VYSVVYAFRRYLIRVPLAIFPIPVRRRLRNNEEMNLFTRVIPNLMRCSGGNPNPLASIQLHQTATHFHKGLAREHVEELLRVMVEVANLRRARRHALLNHAELRVPYQVPTIATVTPDVVLGRQFADSFGVTLDSSQFRVKPPFS